MRVRFLLKIVTLASLSAAVAAPALAQTEEPGVPISFSITTRADIHVVTMPAIDIPALLTEDSLEELEGRPFRFGYGYDVDYDLHNSGTWETLSDGSRLWRLRIDCPGAYSINLVYRDFRLPKGARLFVYNEDASMVIGAFTEKNNKEYREFATRPVRGDVTILEYHEPAHVEQPGTVSIRRVVYGYKDVFNWATIEHLLRDYDDADWCENNVNCPIGDPWYNEKRSVAMVLLAGGTRWCSGALVNNVDEDETQYFLTAWHCGGAEATWIFMFNYQSAFCPNEDGPTNMTVQGSVHRATNAYSDFLLVEISEAIPAAYKVYYSGWDARDLTDPWAMCLHHPQGDIKKITRYPNGTAGAPWTLGGAVGDGVTDSHWEVELVDVANNGAVEHGSSGSPLYDPNHRIVGQLTGGSGGYCVNGNLRYYGKFFHDMDYGANAATRLREWLDPGGTGTDQLDGHDSYNVDAAVMLIDRTGSMLIEIDGGPENRFDRAKELAKGDVDDLFDNYPGVEVSVVSFYADYGGPTHIETWIGFSNVRNDVLDAIDDIGTPLPEYWTPLAEGLIHGADQLFPISSPLNRSLYVFTDGEENMSVHDGGSPVCGHCDVHLGGDPVADHWEPDCDPYDNDPVCDPYQTCLADAFIANGIVNVRYFGQRITKQGVHADVELPDQFLAATSKVSETASAGSSELAHSRQLPEYAFLQYISDSSGGFFSFDADENQPPIASCRNVTVYADRDCLAIASVNNGSYDPDGDPVAIVEDPLGPYALGSTLVTLIVTDTGGLADTCQGTVTVVDTTSPVCDVVPNDTIILLCQPEEICLPVGCTDNCDPDPTITVVGGPGAIIGDYWCYTPAANETFDVTLHCEDSSRNFCEATFHVAIWMARISITKTHNTLQGQHEYVSITFDGLGFTMGGLDMLIAYDRSALNFQAVVEGDLYDQCDWEYFTYRTWFWPSYEPHFFWAGIVRVVGIADMNDGPYHPSCFTVPTPFVLFTIDFLVTDNRLFECQFVPINFFWMNCGDNAISSITGDTLYIDRKIYDFTGNLVWDEEDDDLFPEDARIPNVGAPDYCLNADPEKPSAWRLICFVNGGVDIICADSVDDRGDINLNGVPNEIADAVVFTNYFIYGFSAFHVNTDGQIAATDVNADGLTLTVGDLVYLIRVVVGDAMPYPKLEPVAAAYTCEDGVVSVDAEMGAAYVIVEGNVTPTLLAEHMDMKYAYDAKEYVTHVLVYSMERDDVFSRDFLRVDGKVVGIEMATYDGAPVTLSLIPTEFALHQNFPNPFNPITTITFALPIATDYRLVIYNVMGEEVTSFEGYSEPGLIRADWDASNCASGVYLYKLTAGSFTDTRKMVLLK